MRRVLGELSTLAPSCPLEAHLDAPTCPLEAPLVAAICALLSEACRELAAGGTLVFPPAGDLALPPAGTLELPPAGTLALPPAGALALPPAGTLALPPVGSLVVACKRVTWTVDFTACTGGVGGTGAGAGAVAFAATFPGFACLEELAGAFARVACCDATLLAGASRSIVFIRTETLTLLGFAFSSASPPAAEEVEATFAPGLPGPVGGAGLGPVAEAFVAIIFPSAVRMRSIWRTTMGGSLFIFAGE